MTKIMLVEDDKSLREIYGVRLLAEGYDIVSAGDGEEALAMAIKERPQLIISDVMMPKISGFDLLDILRSTTETKNIRVIMMTALSSDDQRTRGEQLGADRYLVKSQVGIEDVVRVVHEILEDQPAGASEAAAPTPVAPAVQPAAATAPSTTPSSLPPANSTPLPVPTPAAPAEVKPPQARAKIIQPINDPSIGVNLNDLLSKEIAKEAGIDTDSAPQVASTAEVQAQVNSQIDQVVGSPAETETTPTADNPASEPPAVVATPTESQSTDFAPASQFPLTADSDIPTINVDSSTGAVSGNAVQIDAPKADTAAIETSLPTPTVPEPQESNSSTAPPVSPPAGTSPEEPAKQI